MRWKFRAFLAVGISNASGKVVLLFSIENQKPIFWETANADYEQCIDVQRSHFDCSTSYPNTSFLKVYSTFR